jgi:hypothetical protein
MFQFTFCKYVSMSHRPRLIAGFPPRRPEIELMSDHVGFMVDKVALGQVFSEYFGFPCQSTASHSPSIIGVWYSRSVSGGHAKWTQSHCTPRNYKIVCLIFPLCRCHLIPFDLITSKLKNHPLSAVRDCPIWNAITRHAWWHISLFDYATRCYVLLREDVRTYPTCNRNRYLVNWHSCTMFAFWVLYVNQ